MPAIEKSVMLGAVKRKLQSLGYEGELLQENYAFRDFFASGATSLTVPRVPIAAFAQSPPSYRSACFGVTLPDENGPDAIKIYRALGAPQVLALYPNTGCIRRWKISATRDPELLEEFSYSEIDTTFERRRVEWEPQRILDARTLSFSANAAQLDFFDEGLLPALESALHPQLTEDIERIMQCCRTVYAQEYDNADFENDPAPVFRLVFRLIAAKVLIDRDYRPEWINLDAPSVISAVDDFYFSEETPEPALQNIAVQSAAWLQVQRRLPLQNLSVETLAYLYENAFVSQELRRDQSIYATPPLVADYLLRQLPIEKLSIMERRIFEPFTGHAPFLTAALRRLRELLPKDISPQERHDYFVAMLSGIENEPFAREIARYALILADYPNPDGWRISGQDAFTGNDFDKLIQESNIVLCNPPFGRFNPEQREAISLSQRLKTNGAKYEATYTKEVESLRRVVAIRPAMLGFVLPRSFLDNKAFLKLRLDIAAHYSSISITALPDKAFNKASEEVVLLAAHNIALPNEPYSYAVVTSKGYEAFLRTTKPSWKNDYGVLNRTNNDVELWRTPLQSVWDSLGNHHSLGKFAEIHRGIEYKSGLLSGCISNEQQEDFVPGVQTVRDYLEPYTIRDYQYLCNKPEVMRDTAYLLAWDTPKILVGRARSSRGYWNISGAVEDMGLRASQQYCGVWPMGETQIELLAAIISGPVANAFLYNHRAGRDNQIRLIEQIPVPSFTDEQTEFIVWAVQEYSAQRGQWLASEDLDEHFEAKCLELLYWIDAAVLEAYALPADLERELLGAFEGAERRPLPFHFPGYGVEYELAKVSFQNEKAHRITLKRYHELVDKEFLGGLTADEQTKQESLGREVDAFYAPFYKSILEKLKTGQI